jgi:hypothetical protein
MINAKNVAWLPSRECRVFAVIIFGVAIFEQITTHHFGRWGEFHLINASLLTLSDSLLPFLG